MGKIQALPDQVVCLIHGKGTGFHGIGISIPILIYHNLSTHPFLVKEENGKPFEGKFEGHPLRCIKEPICVFWLVSSYKTCLNTGRNRSILFLAFLLMQEFYIPQLIQIAPFHSHQLLISKINTVPVFQQKITPLFVVLKVTFAAPPSRLNRVIVPCPSIFTTVS